MSEDQGDYITDAVEMLGAGYQGPAAIIEEPRRRRVMGERPGFDEQETAAWVKLSTAFKPHIKELKGAPLAVWLYLSLSINRNGIAFPGIRTMADDLGYSHQGIIEAITALEEKGYLTVTRGKKRYNLYQPEFAAIGRGKEPVNLVDSSLNESTFSPNESTFFSNESTPVDSNKSNKSNKILRAEKSTIEKANQKVDAILQLERQASQEKVKGWTYREKFSFNQDILDLADCCAAKFGPPSKRDLSLWIMEIGEWVDFGVRAKDWARAQEIVAGFSIPILSVTGMTKALRVACQERKNEITKPERPELKKYVPEEGNYVARPENLPRPNIHRSAPETG